MRILRLSWSSRWQARNQGLKYPFVNPMLRLIHAIAKRSAIAIAGLSVALAIAGCSGFSSVTPATPAPAEGVPKQLLERQLIVTLSPDVMDQWDDITAALVAAYGLPKVGAFPLQSIRVKCLVFHIPASLSLPAIQAQLEADPRVETVQTNQFFQSQLRPYNDPYGKFQYGVQSIGAARAHAASTGKGIKIAVIDTGIDVEHPDLRERIAATANFVAGGESKFAQDRHGTAVAGVIAARADNAIGIFGVAPDAEIIALKACWHRSATFGQAWCSSWTLARAVDVAIQQRARILNLSLAGPSDPLLERLLAQAASHGITVVAATLPAPQELGFPAMLETVIAVVASDLQKQVTHAPTASRAALLAAPGVDIVTTAPKQTYDFLSGSSLAAAHVSGIVALLLERDPTLSPTAIQRLLQTTARPLQALASPSATAIGLVDACTALRQLLPDLSCP